MMAQVWIVLPLRYLTLLNRMRLRDMRKKIERYMNQHCNHEHLQKTLGLGNVPTHKFEIWQTAKD